MAWRMLLSKRIDVLADLDSIIENEIKPHFNPSLQHQHMRSLKLETIEFRPALALKHQGLDAGLDVALATIMEDSGGPITIDSMKHW
ncbi:MAG: hypothetical protein ACI9NY_000111 [Kiritimatiellia bacterium]|jgi:hypothetical protein